MAKSKKLNKIKKQVVNEKVIDRRIFFFSFAVILLFLAIIFKLSYIMLIDANNYKKSLKILTNNIVEGPSTPRGRILDRNYNVLVDNIAVRTIYYKKSKKISTQKEIELAYLVSSHLDLDYSKLYDDSIREFYYLQNKDKLKKRITENEWKSYSQGKLTNNDIKKLEKMRIKDEELASFTDSDKKAAYLYYLMNKGYSYDEKTIKTGNNLKEEEYAYISENIDKLDGFSTKLDWERTYPYGSTFKSMLGKISTSTQGIPEEYKDYYLAQGYSLNDRVGLSYIEKQYEKYLKGTKEKYEVMNSTELKLVEEGKRGNDIVLTIDINLQKEVERILEEQVRLTKSENNTRYYDHSSVVIQDPKTGEILAMSSKKLVGDTIIDNTATILTSPVTPGSIVKGASMLVGYNTGAIKPGEVMYDECIKVAGVPEKCSSVLSLGYIDDITALAKSSNVYQFKTAIRVNGQEYYYDMKMNFNQDAFDTYRKMYHSFGLGVKTEIDLPFESSGYAAKDTRAGNLLDFVMGQYETYTPMQLSQYITTIANSGERLQPHLLKEVRKATEKEELGKVIYSSERKVLNKVETDPVYMQRVKEGFYAVMHADGGYGRSYMKEWQDGSGKTGTSQSFIDTDNDGVIDTETITSSFIGYAPTSDPKFSIIVTSPNSSDPTVESMYASPVTKRITNEIVDKIFEMYP